jgi:sulfur carrier protein ThiS
LIKVKVRLYANLQKYLPTHSVSNSLEVELKEGTTIEGLLEQLHIPAHEAKGIFVNFVIREASDVLQHNDQVGIFSPIGGGRT